MFAVRVCFAGGGKYAHYLLNWTHFFFFFFFSFVLFCQQVAKPHAASAAAAAEAPAEEEITFSAPTVVPLAGRGESLFAGLARGDLAKDEEGDDDLFNLAEKDMDALENAVQVKQQKKAKAPEAAPEPEPKKKSAKEIFGDDGEDDEDLFALAGKSGKKAAAKKVEEDDDDDLFALAVLSERGYQ
jgi:hypothetical protein